MSLLPRWLVLLFVLSGIATAQPASSLRTPEEIGVFMQTYHLNPQPDRIPQLIAALGKSGLMQQRSAQSGVIGFFSELLAANPEQSAAWIELIARQDEPVKAVLNQAVSLSKTGGVLKLEGHSPSLNDEYWGAYSAGGDPRIIEKLAEQLRYFDEREDLNLFMTAASAKWSLSSVSQSQPPVRKALQDAKQHADKRTQQLIDDLLKHSPDSVRQETAEIIRKQRQSGKW